MPRQIRRIPRGQPPWSRASRRGDKPRSHPIPLAVALSERLARYPDGMAEWNLVGLCVAEGARASDGYRAIDAALHHNLIHRRGSLYFFGPSLSADEFSHRQRGGPEKLEEKLWGEVLGV